MVVPKQELGNQDLVSHEIVIIYLRITLSNIKGPGGVSHRGQWFWDGLGRLMVAALAFGAQPQTAVDEKGFSAEGLIAIEFTD